MDPPSPRTIRTPNLAQGSLPPKFFACGALINHLKTIFFGASRRHVLFHYFINFIQDYMYKRTEISITLHLRTLISQYRYVIITIIIMVPLVRRNMPDLEPYVLPKVKKIKKVKPKPKKRKKLTKSGK